MAIIQISKIQVRSGDLVDLPLLDEAEFGFANDEKRLFIGKTTPNENVEILTAYSSLSFSQIAGADGANLSLSLFEDGQVLAISDIGGNVNVVNRGGTKGGAINLGDVANLTILGGGSGQVLTTDGTGNLTWEPSGGPGGAPGGTNTMIQFNDSSSFGGNTGFTFDKITGNVAMPGNLAVSGAIALTATTLGALNFYDANGSPTDTSLYYNSVGDVLTLALNSNDQITIYNGNVTISDDLFVQGAISLSATACAAINFFDANSSATDTSIYYNSISDVLTIALNNVDKLTIGNTIITANDDLSVNGAISLVATACAAINFYDANSTATDSSIYYNSISDNFAIALNNVDKIEVFNANVTIHDDLFVEGAISLAATACAAINFFDANSTATDSSIYYNSISDNFAIALNNVDKIEVFNANVTIHDDLFVEGAISLAATACAAINFFDANSTSTDSSIYYNSISDNFAIALNNVDKIEVFNANITLHDDLIVEGAIALVATACAAINFYDAGGSATDTAIYYNSGSDVLTISLNGLDQIIVGNANTTVTNNFIANGANVNFTAATNVALGSNTTVKITGGLNGQYLRTDGSGGLSWATVTSGGAPGGSNTMIQFNDGGSSFGGNNFFTFDKTSGNVQIPGNTDIGGNLIIGNASSPTGAALNFRDANIANTDTSIYYTAVSEEGLYVAVNQAQTPGNGPKFGFQNNRNISYQDLTIVDGNLNSANVTTFNLANANATTINFGGAATTIEIGNSSGTTNINHNLDVDGNLNIDGTTLSTTSGTFNIANANTTTLNIGGAATTINMGAAGALFDFPGNLFIANAINFRDANGANTDTAIYYSSDYLGINLNSGLTPKVTIENTQVSITDNLVVKGGNIITDKTTFNLLNSTATTLNMGGAATTVNIGAAGSAGTLTISNDNTVLNGDLQVKGGDLTTNQTTFNLLNTTATTINFGGAATTVEIGSGSGTTNVNNNLDVDGDVNIDGGDLTVSTAAFNLANTNVTTLNIGGSATTVNLGNTSGTLTIRNASTVLNGDLAVNGGDITTTQTTANLFPANALTVNIGGGASTINIGNTGSLTSIAGNILLANAINFTDAAAPNTDSAIFYTAAGTEGFYITLNGSDRFLVSNSNATYSLNADLVISGAGYKIGYSAAPLGGTGGSVSQLTSRTTGVTINKATGNIVLVSAAGSASWNTFTVTNSVVGADDVIIVNQKSGTDKYQTFVTNVAAGSFQITFATTGGTTTESPVFNFSVIRGATS